MNTVKISITIFTIAIIAICVTIFTIITGNPALLMIPILLGYVIYKFLFLAPIVLILSVIKDIQVNAYNE